MFSNNRAVNVLAAARVFLFASRDVWFVVGLPVFLRTELGWSFWEAGAFLAVWVIGYGAVQAATPGFARKRADGTRAQPDGRVAAWLAFALAACPAGMALALESGSGPDARRSSPAWRRSASCSRSTRPFTRISSSPTPRTRAWR